MVARFPLQSLQHIQNCLDASKGAQEVVKLANRAETAQPPKNGTGVRHGRPSQISHESIDI